jgi:hypothetical protein
MRTGIQVRAFSWGRGPHLVEGDVLSTRNYRNCRIVGVDGPGIHGRIVIPDFGTIFGIGEYHCCLNEPMDRSMESVDREEGYEWKIASRV